MQTLIIGYRVVNHVVAIMCADRAESNDCAKSEGTITRLHMWRSIWPPPHIANTGVTKETRFPLLDFLSIITLYLRVDRRYISVEWTHFMSRTIIFLTFGRASSAASISRTAPWLRNNFLTIVAVPEQFGRDVREISKRNNFNQNKAHRKEFEI